MIQIAVKNNNRCFVIFWPEDMACQCKTIALKCSEKMLCLLISQIKTIIFKISRVGGGIHLLHLTAALTFGFSNNFSDFLDIFLKARFELCNTTNIIMNDLVAGRGFSAGDSFNELSL